MHNEIPLHSPKVGAWCGNIHSWALFVEEITAHGRSCHMIHYGPWVSCHAADVGCAATTTKTDTYIDDFHT